MKQIFKNLCTAIFMLAALSCSAQQASSKKLSLFNKYPAAINCTEDQLNNLFSVDLQKEVSIKLPGNLLLEGPVVIKQNKNSKLQTVSIKLPAFNNILFSVTKRNDEKNNPVFTGYLFSNDFADGYRLIRKPDQTYQLIKIEMEKLLPTCNH